MNTFTTSAAARLPAIDTLRGLAALAVVLCALVQIHQAVAGRL